MQDQLYNETNFDWAIIPKGLGGLSTSFKFNVVKHLANYTEFEGYKCRVFGESFVTNLELFKTNLVTTTSKNEILTDAPPISIYIYEKNVQFRLKATCYITEKTCYVVSVTHYQASFKDCLEIETKDYCTMPATLLMISLLSLPKIDKIIIYDDAIKKDDDSCNTCSHVYMALEKAIAYMIDEGYFYYYEHESNEKNGFVLSDKPPPPSTSNFGGYKKRRRRQTNKKPKGQNRKTRRRRRIRK
jgi:hypothetical protein